MEVILTIVIIIVLCVCLGVEIELLALGAVILALLMIAAMFILFAYSIIRLAVSKKHEAEFTKIDKSPRSRFDTAYYKVDGVEYPCAFPSEVLMKKRIYNSEKKYTVRLDKRMKNVYDRYAELTCVIGFVFSFAAVAFIVLLVLSVVGIV